MKQKNSNKQLFLSDRFLYLFKILILNMKNNLIFLDLIHVNLFIPGFLVIFV